MEMFFDVETNIRVNFFFGGAQKSFCKVKLRHYVKATKFEKKSPTCFDVDSVTSRQVGDFFKFLWPSQKT